jgi:DNA-binding beta-propeller fold protein YncE
MVSVSMSRLGRCQTAGWVAGLLLAAGALLAAGCSRKGGAAAEVTEGEPTVDYERVYATRRNVRAPEFPSGMTWLNTGRELSLRELRGRFVLLDFWTYCCINCIHTMPDLAYLERKYAGQPFVAIGVHSAKFTNERDSDNIRQAIMRYEIAHPVVNDAEMAIWRSYSVSSWPTLVLIDPGGYVVWAASGEGHRETMDAILAAGLQYYGERGVLDRTPLELEREARPASDLAYPGKLALDPEKGLLYISDSNHNRIVVTDLDGRFVDVIGSGAIGLDDGPYGEATFNRLQGLALYEGDLIVADAENHALRRVDTERRTVRTIAGTGEQSRTYARGSGKGREVALSTPWDVVVVGDTLYIAMAGTHQVWSYDLARDHVEPFAGTGREARIDGPTDRAAFAQPSGLATDGKTLFVADSEISSVRAIDLASGRVTTVVGGDLFDFGDRDGVGDRARLQHCLGVLFHQGKLYVADTYNHKIKIVDPTSRMIRTYLGTGRPGSRDGDSPEFYEPSGFAAVGDRLYVADTNNHAIRVVDLTTDRVSTLELTGVPTPMTSPVHAKASVEPEELPGVVIAPGEGRIRVAVALPFGHHLTEGAPSGYKVEIEGAALKVEAPTGSVAAAEFAVPYVATEGMGSVTLEVTLYHCGVEGICQVRTVAWRVPIEVREGGASTVEIKDRLPVSLG